MGTVRFITGGESGMGVKLITHFNLVPTSRVVELYLHSPICLHSIVPNYLIKCRDKFTFV
jgi:hypothetical protein